LFSIGGGGFSSSSSTITTSSSTITVSSTFSATEQAKKIKANTPKVANALSKNLDTSFL